MRLAVLLAEGVLCDETLIHILFSVGIFTAEDMLGYDAAR